LSAPILSSFSILPFYSNVAVSGSLNAPAGSVPPRRALRPGCAQDPTKPRAVDRAKDPRPSLRATPTELLSPDARTRAASLPDRALPSSRPFLHRVHGASMRPSVSLLFPLIHQFLFPLTCLFSAPLTTALKTDHLFPSPVDPSLPSISSIKSAAEPSMPFPRSPCLLCQAPPNILVVVSRASYREPHRSSLPRRRQSLYA
jgi:hypothetical protein